jgi:hypothetical protein
MNLMKIKDLNHKIYVGNRSTIVKKVRVKRKFIDKAGEKEK